MSFLNWLRQTHNRLTQPWPIDVIQVVPANSPGPWSGSPAIGQEQPFASSSNNTQNLIKMDEFGLPDVWTITLGATYSDQAWPAVSGNLGVRAEIEIGVGGAIHTFEIDWADGVSFSVTANSIRINAFYFPFAPGIPIKPPSDLRLRAMVARGTRAGRIAPTFTGQFIDVFTGGGPVTTNFIRIPPFATELYILPQNLGGTLSPYNASNHLHLYESTNPGLTAGVEIYDTPLSVLNQVTPVRIPGSARYYNLVIAAGNFNGILIPLFNIGL